MNTQDQTSPLSLVPSDLQAGYNRFRQGRLAEFSRQYQDLAHSQKPKTLIIGCADSRVDPSTIFDAGPGDLFVVRNVANIVPPFAISGQGSEINYHGTSAAIEYAVVELGVENIVVMGHGGCGGVSACIASRDHDLPHYFISQWVSMLDESRDRVMEEQAISDPAQLQRALEYEGIRQSIANLKGFPFVHQALVSRGLKIHGAWFAIGEAALHWMMPDGAFDPVAKA